MSKPRKLMACEQAIKTSTTTTTITRRGTGILIYIYLDVHIMSFADSAPKLMKKRWKQIEVFNSGTLIACIHTLGDSEVDSAQC